jgi:uncharacterized protein (TIGR03083 family)
MQLDEYLAAIATESGLMAATAAEAGFAAAVPTCPGWTVRDAVLHTGEVHRWATAVLRLQLGNLGHVPEDFLGALPNDAGVLDWFRSGVADLIDALRTADPTVGYATFLENPPQPPLMFWARRQAHELGMHRVDVESAFGRCTPFAPAYAADGIDEFLCGFVSRKRTPLRSDVTRTLVVAPTDVDDRWMLTISEDPPRGCRLDAAETDAAQHAADCVVGGAASDLYRALWNRGDLAPLDLEGDGSALELVRDSVHIRWS